MKPLASLCTLLAAIAALLFGLELAFDRSTPGALPIEALVVDVLAHEPEGCDPGYWALTDEGGWECRR